MICNRGRIVEEVKRKMVQWARLPSEWVEEGKESPGKRRHRYSDRDRERASGSRVLVRKSIKKWLVNKSCYKLYDSIM